MMLELQQVGKGLPFRRSLFREGRSVRALHDVSFAIARGESFGLVGESGSGKTTLTRCILRLEEPSAGRILFDGQDMARLSAAAVRALRSKIQIVFQDPYASLNPRMSVHDIVTEPMLIHRRVPRPRCPRPHGPRSGIAGAGRARAAASASLPP